MKTFIFGAGASIPFFDSQLTTDCLTNKVRDKDAWDKIIEKYKDKRAKRGETTNVPRSEEIINVIEHIKNFNKKANFELIAEVIDKICSCGANAHPKSFGRKTLNIILSVLNGGRNECVSQFWPGWTSVPFLFREIIAEFILDLEKTHKSQCYDLLSRLQHDFIKYVCDRDSRDSYIPGASLMSLNYDDCIYDSLQGLDFELGFSECSVQINKMNFLNAPKVAYFLHGNIKFQFADNGGVTFWADSNKANEERWNNRRCAYGTPGEFADNYNTFILTGQTKEEGLNYMPYAIYYQRLAVDLFRSNEAYIVGYSFGDKHINRLLHSFLYINPNNKIFIVDFTDDVPLKPDLPNLEKHGIIWKIHDELGRNWTLEGDFESGFKPVNSEGVEEIRNQGYGELFPQVVFYRKGYREFLTQFEEVLEYYYRKDMKLLGFNN